MAIFNSYVKLPEGKSFRYKDLTVKCDSLGDFFPNGTNFSGWWTSIIHEENVHSIISIVDNGTIRIRGTYWPWKKIYIYIYVYTYLYIYNTYIYIYRQLYTYAYIYAYIYRIPMGTWRLINSVGESMENHWVFPGTICRQPRMYHSKMGVKKRWTQDFIGIYVVF